MAAVCRHDNYCLLSKYDASILHIGLILLVPSVRKVLIQLPASFSQEERIMSKSGTSFSAACAIGCLAAGFSQTTVAAGAWNDAALAAIWSSDPAGFCATIKDMYIRPQAIGLPTSGAVVTATTFVPATAGVSNLGEYCRVEGGIRPVDPTAPEIRFRINLPTAWNGKAVQFGGGGYNGVMPNTTGRTTLGLLTPTTAFPSGPTTTPAPLALGYITFAGDSGHQAADSNDASFGMNDEAVLNFGYMHIKKTLDIAVEIAKARYGKKPKRVYFSGGSTGGREGLTAALRFPKDYDGILTNYPVANYMGLRLWGAGLARAIYDNDSEGWIPPALVNQISSLANQRCDALDGAADGLVSNMAACRAMAPKLLEELSCKNGETGNITSGYPPNCLTQKQIERTLAIYHEGYTLPYSFAYGVNNYPGYNSLEGILMQIGSQPKPLDPITTVLNAHHGDRADQFVRYFVARDPSYSVLNLDIFNPGAHFQDRIIQLSWDLGALNPDYTAFMKHGGKILWLQGNDDPSVSPYSNIDVYNRIVDHMGQKNVDSFLRFYLVPGLAHGGGRFSPVWDNLTTLDNWVENGMAPSAAPVVYDGTNTSTRGRSRPLCEYPTWPKYNGSGDVDVATSYTCVSQ
jgi:hypothetical protein